LFDEFGAVQTDGVDAKAHFAGAGLGEENLIELEGLRSADFMKTDDANGG